MRLRLINGREVTGVKTFDGVYEQYREMIYKFCLRLCGNEVLADELTQETFYKALKRIDRFRGESSLSTWLCGIAKHEYCTAMRREAPLPLDELETQSDDGFAEKLIDSDEAMTAQRMLHELPEPYREVFTLRTFAQLSHAQIAELFGKSESWARVTYYRARQMLIEKLNQKEEHKP